MHKIIKEPDALEFIPGCYAFDGLIEYVVDDPPEEEIDRMKADKKVKSILSDKPTFEDQLIDGKLVKVKVADDTEIKKAPPGLKARHQIPPWREVGERVPPPVVPDLEIV